MPVTITPTRYSVEVPESAWATDERRTSRKKLQFEAVTVRATPPYVRWFLMHGRDYILLLPSGRSVEYGEFFIAQQWAEHHGVPLFWPNASEAQEALSCYLAAGGKLP